mmetsp:Transcript_73757/g.196613  ORF Transcript_73757/g.196613 Transcript_73757/m.196613 type:complete len:340 (-) Transcript_73757:8-1027(-)
MFGSSAATPQTDGGYTVLRESSSGQHFECHRLRDAARRLRGGFAQAGAVRDRSTGRWEQRTSSPTWHLTRSPTAVELAQELAQLRVKVSVATQSAEKWESVVSSLQKEHAEEIECLNHHIRLLQIERDEACSHLEASRRSAKSVDHESWARALIAAQNQLQSCVVALDEERTRNSHLQAMVEGRDSTGAQNSAVVEQQLHEAISAMERHEIVNEEVHVRLRDLETLSESQKREYEVQVQELRMDLHAESEAASQANLRWMTTRDASELQRQVLEETRVEAEEWRLRCSELESQLASRPEMDIGHLLPCLRAAGAAVEELLHEKSLDTGDHCLHYPSTSQ